MAVIVRANLFGAAVVLFPLFLISLKGWKKIPNNNMRSQGAETNTHNINHIHTHTSISTYVCRFIYSIALKYNKSKCVWINSILISPFPIFYLFLPFHAKALYHHPPNSSHSLLPLEMKTIVFFHPSFPSSFPYPLLYLLSGRGSFGHLPPPFL